MIEPPRKRGPFDPRWSGTRSHRHLRLVPMPDPAAAETSVAVAGETDHGFTDVTYLPAFMPITDEYDRHEREDRDATTTEDARGTGPHREEEPEGRRDGEDVRWQVAAVLPVPRL